MNKFLKSSCKISFCFYLCLLTLPSLSCTKKGVAAHEGNVRHPIENVIVVVIDGPRYSETWGDTTYKYMPNMGRVLSKQGALFTNFYNTGNTKTNPGHTAIATGVKQQIDNNGHELPQYPSLLHHWLQQTCKPASSAWLITSKDKLNVLANTTHPDWKDKYTPSMNCGINGSGKGYRRDSLTTLEAKRVLKEHQPNLAIINFREPDYSGHKGSWDGYLKGIQDTDRYVAEIWELIQKNPHYKDRTLLLVTNDHGRHSDGHADGFVSHGDSCNGCRHISLFALSPNSTARRVISTNYEQIDIPVTIAKILGFEMPYAQGKVIEELL